MKSVVPEKASIFQAFSRGLWCGFIALGTLVYSESEVLAQATCRADVSYSLKRSDAEESVVVKQEEARGAEEATVKEALTQRLIISRQEALTLCRDRHENLSTCVASKYAKNGGLIQQLPFAARVKLQDAIEADCKAQQGTCREGKANEPVCTVIKPIETPVADAPAEKEAGKSGKKGGKK